MPEIYDSWDFGTEGLDEELDKSEGLRSDEYYLSIIRATNIDPTTGQKMPYYIIVPVEGVTPTTETTEGMLYDAWDFGTEGVTERQEVSLETISTDTLQQWINFLRQMDEDGRLPEEWKKLVEGGVTIHSQFSDILEANTFDNVKNLETRAMYNFWTSLETNTSIENIVVNPNIPQARYVDVLWTPMTTAISVEEIDRTSIIEERPIEEIEELLANNFSGTTVETSVSEDLGLEIIRSIR